MSRRVAWLLSVKHTADEPWQNMALFADYKHADATCQAYADSDQYYSVKLEAMEII